MVKKNYKKKDEFAWSGSEKQQETLREIEEGMAKFNDNFFDTFEEDNTMYLKTDETRMRDKMDMMNQMLTRNMLAMVTAPMLQDINAKNLSSTLGMFMGVYMTNPTFRKHLQDAQKERREAKHEKQMVRLEKRAERTGKILDHFGLSPELNLSMKRLESKIKKDNGGRMPYSPRTAAQQYLMMNLQAYDKMQKAGSEEEVNEIMEKFNKNKELLFKLAKQDGVSAQNIHEDMNRQLAHLKQKHPDIMMKFNEAAYGGYDLEKDENGVFTGKMVDHAGGYLDKPLTPRVPLTRNTVKEHFEKFAKRQTKIHPFDVEDPKEMSANAKDLFAKFSAYRKCAEHDGLKSDEMDMLFNDYFDDKLTKVRKEVFVDANTKEELIENVNHPDHQAKVMLWMGGMMKCMMSGVDAKKAGMDGFMKELTIWSEHHNCNRWADGVRYRHRKQQESFKGNQEYSEDDYVQERVMERKAMADEKKAKREARFRQAKAMFGDIIDDKDLGSTGYDF